MNWTQVINPLSNLNLSALGALLLILFIFWALIINKMKGLRASVLLFTILIAVVIYGRMIYAFYSVLRHSENTKKIFFVYYIDEPVRMTMQNSLLGKTIN